MKNAKLVNVSLGMETSTHMPMLIEMVQRTKGHILEIGSGLFSTPLLHWLCFESKRKLTTIESYKHYLEFANRFKADWHDVIFIKPTSKPIVEGHFSVVFIDHSPKKPRTRGDDVLLYKDNADYIILHDAGEKAMLKYDYQKVYSQFKYVKHWTGCVPHTTVLSNFYEI